MHSCQPWTFLLGDMSVSNPAKNSKSSILLLDVSRFETMGVPGLYIGVQAVLALYASFVAAEKGGGVS